MNRILAETLTALNGVIAIAIVIGAAFMGYRLFSGSPFGVFFGAAIGLLIAALSCGVIAYLVLIERHLAKLAGVSRDEDIPASTRREPRL
ncbi:hypothetical protein [Aquamicrobium sp. LC103]|uniref:hypothetical protein n=1 Tax=Aquamicrobium sp. LC103 TaxID=1120658 RepID=UPI00063ED2FE|nr:hypothetical protein [Aquamicrobium sp. LC103]TKT79968.1 hypothetical protein XW59_006290 [Aquamicrobium sp. LC103]